MRADQRTEYDNTQERPDHERIDRCARQLRGEPREGIQNDKRARDASRFSDVRPAASDEDR